MGGSEENQFLPIERFLGNIWREISVNFSVNNDDLNHRLQFVWQ